MYAFKSWLVALILAVSAVVAPALAQERYPERPVRIIVGFTAGSSTDITARIFAQKFSEAWGVAVTVENIPGVGGSIGVDRVAKAEPDGYTLMYAGNGALTITPVLQGTPYDPATDLAPIAIALEMPSILAVHESLPAKTLQELFALARATPGRLSYATPGAGTPQHIAGELLKSLAGVDIVHVPYRGAVLTDVLGGRVPITFQNAGAILPIVRDKKLRGIALSALKRSPVLPDLPTIAEQGFPGFEATSWFAFLAPANTPRHVIDKVHQETLNVLAQPSTRERFAQLALDPIGSSPAQLGDAIRRDLVKWGKVIKEANIKAGE